MVPQAAEALRKDLKCPASAGTPAEVAAQSDVVILAVKPADMKALCEGLANG